MELTEEQAERLNLDIFAKIDLAAPDEKAEPNLAAATSVTENAEPAEAHKPKKAGKRSAFKGRVGP